MYTERVKVFSLTLFFIISFNSFSKVNVVYSEAADVFEIMDHVSLWTTKLPTAIRRHWEKKFGEIGGEDLNLINQYIALRRKSDSSYSSYVEEASPVISLFGDKGITKVPLSMAFYSSKSVGEALKKVGPYITVREYKFLTKFYKHFLPKIQTMVKESTSFKSHTTNYQKSLKKVFADKILKRFSQFLGLKMTAKTGIKFIVSWWPNNEEPRYDFRGNYIFLRYHPLSSAKVWSGESLLNAAVKTYMAHLSPNQKTNSTKIFNRKCSGRAIEFNNALESIWVRALPEKWKLKKKFSLQKKWSEDTFTNLFIKLMFPLVEENINNKQNIEGTFIHQSSQLCAELHKLATRA